MKILAIETSCDETAAAVVELGPSASLGMTNRSGQDFKILSKIVSSQEKIHAKFGGIVPEVAARKHVEMMIPVLDKALAGLDLQKDIHAIAVTYGPGLITSLGVGVETAKTLALVHKKPLIAVNHIEAHALSSMIDDNKLKKIKFPAICLVVSGGHTQIVLIKKIGDYKIVGQTLDDAAGEAFDKVAKILGLGYPGGPAISRLADEIPRPPAKRGVRDDIWFARPMMQSQNLDFSFSGIKTSVLYKWRDLPKKTKKIKAVFAREFQQAVVDVLVAKTIRAAEKFNAKTVMIGGGVSANKVLREQMQNAVAGFLPEAEYIKPNVKYSTDNAVMIGLVGAFKFQKKDFVEPFGLRADPNLEI